MVSLRRAFTVLACTSLVLVVASRSSVASNTIDTVIGSEHPSGPLAPLATGLDPSAVIVDADGTVRFASAAAVYSLASDGIRLAIGTGLPGKATDGQPSGEAAFDTITALAHDPAGNTWIADGGNHVILRHDAVADVVRRVAGTGEPGSGPDGPDARLVPLGTVPAMAARRDGGLFFAERSSFRVRHLDPSGQLRTIAGTGEPAAADAEVPPGIPATGVALGLITDIDVGPDGRLWIADATRGAVIEIDIENGTAQAVVAKIADPLDPGAPPAPLDLSHPTAVAALPDASGVLVADRWCDASGKDDCSGDKHAERVFLISVPAGEAQLLIGGGDPATGVGDGPLLAARVGLIADLGFGPDGRLWVCDGLNRRLRAADLAAASIATAAGNGAGRWNGDGGPAEQTLLASPSAVAPLNDDVVLIADTHNDRIRLVDLRTGEVGTAIGGGQAVPNLGDGGDPGLAELRSPRDVHIGPGGEIWVADTGHGRVRRVDPELASIRTVAGGGTSDPAGGAVLATAARLLEPVAVVAAADGRLWIADRTAARVLIVEPDGFVRPYVGGGSEPPDGVPAEAAALRSPTALALGPGDELLVADEELGLVVMVHPGGAVVETIAGGGPALTIPPAGLPAREATLGPAGLTFQPDGRIRIADRLHHRLLDLDGPGGLLTPLAGTGVAGSDGDGGPALAATLRRPRGLATDLGGSRLFVAGEGNHRVRVVELHPLAFVPSIGEGSVSGGDVVRMSANGPIAGLVRVLFGDVPAADARLVDEQTIECTAPPGSFPPARVLVSVELDRGLVLPAGEYLYLNDSPMAVPHPSDPAAGYVVRAGEAITLDGSASFDPNEDVGDAVVRYEWDLDDDGAIDVASAEPLLDVPDLDPFGIAAPGAYPVRLRVEDRVGSADEALAWIHVVDLTVSPPAGSVNGGYPVTIAGVGLAGVVGIRFDTSDSPAVQVVDDRSVTAQVPAGSLPAGAVDIELVFASSSLVLPDAFTYVNDPPVARASRKEGSPGYAIRLGQALALIGTASSDPNEPVGDRVARYAWDLDDDGKIDRRGAKVRLDARELASFGIDRAGDFPVTLHVADLDGTEAADTTTVRVKGKPDRWPNEDFDGWRGDTNDNGVDDALESRQPTEAVDVVVVFEPGTDLEAAAARLAPLATAPPVPIPLISALCLRGTLVEDVLGPVADEARLYRIEEEIEVEADLDVSSASLRASASPTFSPFTAEDQGLTGAGVNIAFLDSGVDDDHPALAEKFVGGFNAFTGDPTSTGSQGNPDDDFEFGGIFHGTHSAGIACGAGATYRGVAPGAKLVDVKVLSSMGRGTSGTVLAGLQWCIQNRDTAWSGQPVTHRGIDVVNLSVSSRLRSDGKDTISMAVDAAVAQGLVVVASAGNSGSAGPGVGAPGAADEAITVGAADDHGTMTRADDTVAPATNYGPRLDDGDSDTVDEQKPDLVAPGVAIRSPQGNIAPAPATSYTNVSGSSAAAAHISGVAALILEAAGGIDPATVKEIVRNTAEPRGTPADPELDPTWSATFGKGLADAYLSLPVDLGVADGVWVAGAEADDVRFFALDGTAPSGGGAAGPHSLAGGRGPVGIAVDGDGGVWLACRENASVTRLNSAGQVRFRVDLAESSGAALATDVFGIAIDARGDAWVALEETGQVARIRKDGRVDASLYAAGTAPVAVAADRFGNVWIANSGSDDVTKLGANGSEVTGSPFVVGTEPSAIVCDRDGHVYVANRGSDDVTILQPSGTAIGTYAAGEKPVEIALDFAGSIWVANDFEFTVTRLDPGGSNATTLDVAAALRGISVAGDGTLWVSQYVVGVGSQVHRIDTDGTLIQSLGVGYGPLNRGDGSGFTYANSVDPEGDHDRDGWLSGEEIDAGSNPFDRRSQPVEITDVTPTSGSVNGNTRVRVEGRGVMGATRVRFGASLGQDLEVVPGGVEVTTPPGSWPPAVVDVEVERPEGTLAVLTGGYTFDNDAPIADADPDSPDDGYAMLAGEDLFLDGRGSSEPNALIGDSIASWAWDVGGLPASGATTTIRAADLATAGLDVAGVYTISLTVTDSLGATDVESVPLVVSGPGESQFLRSDANQDTRVNLADAVFLLNWLFAGGPRPPCLEAGEVNGDFTVDIGDPIWLVSYLFAGTTPPPAPFPACGSAPAPLGCESSTCP